MYNAHKQGLKIVDTLYDATLHQKYFLSLMAVEDIQHEQKVETYLKTIAEALGVKFK